MPASTVYPVIHVNSWVWTLGGVQSSLEYHVQKDVAAGFPAHLLSLFDRNVPSGETMALRLRAATPVWRARQRFAAMARRVGEPRIVIHHDSWGLRWWSDRDRAFRRLVFLHTEVPHLETRLRELAPRVDGVIAINQSMLDRLLNVAPDFPRERLFKVPYFVNEPSLENDMSRAWSRPWRLGFAGRLEHQHKRVDRLPRLIAELDRRGFDYRFEILGEGGAKQALTDALAGHPRVQFCGHLRGADYWEKLAEWDCLILPSDFEGFSRVTMEGMMMGVMPVMPDYSPAAAEVLGPCASIGIYPVGDMAAAAGRVEAYARLADSARADLRRLARDRFRDHTPANYGRVFTAALQKIVDLPSRAENPGPAWWEPWLPLGVHTRLFSDCF